MGYIHTHDMVLGGHYGGTTQVITLEGGTAVRHGVHGQLQLLTNRQSSQLLVKIAVI